MVSTNRVLVPAIFSHVSNDDNNLQDIAYDKHGINKINPSSSPSHPSCEFLKRFEVLESQNFHLNHSEDNKVEYCIDGYKSVKPDRSWPNLEAPSYADEFSSHFF